MKSFRQFLSEDNGLPRLAWEKDPRVGWWKDHDHLTMYHGTHVSRLGSIAKGGIQSPSHGSTAGWVSMTHDPHTAHGYASMHGGETSFRGAGARAQHVPHEDRAVVVARIPREWAEKHMNPHMRGNTQDVVHHLTDRAAYDAHKNQGGRDHEWYAKTELRFKDHVPAHFIQGYMKKKG